MNICLLRNGFVLVCISLVWWCFVYDTDQLRENWEKDKIWSSLFCCSVHFIPWESKDALFSRQLLPTGFADVLPQTLDKIMEHKHQKDMKASYIQYKWSPQEYENCDVMLLSLRRGKVLCQFSARFDYVQIFDLSFCPLVFVEWGQFKFFGLLLQNVEMFTFLLHHLKRPTCNIFWYSTQQPRQFHLV